MSQFNVVHPVNVPLNEVVERLNRGESIFFCKANHIYKVYGVLVRHTPDCFPSEWGAADLEEIGIVTVHLETTFIREAALIEREYREGDSLDSIVHAFDTEAGYIVLAAYLSTDGAHLLVVRSPEGVVISSYLQRLNVRVYE